MRAIVIFLIIVCVGLQYKLWLSDSSVAQWIEIQKKLAYQDDKNKEAAARNRALEADIIELKSSDQALEEQARSELGMIQQDEVYYHFAN